MRRNTEDRTANLGLCSLTRRFDTCHESTYSNRQWDAPHEHFSMDIALDIGGEICLAFHRHHTLQLGQRMKQWTNGLGMDAGMNRYHTGCVPHYRSFNWNFTKH